MGSAGSTRRVFFGDEPAIQPPNISPPVYLSPTIDCDIIAELYSDEVLVAYPIRVVRPMLYPVTGTDLPPDFNHNVLAVVYTERQSVEFTMRNHYDPCVPNWFRRVCLLDGGIQGMRIERLSLKGILVGDCAKLKDVLNAHAKSSQETYCQHFPEHHPIIMVLFYISHQTDLICQTKTYYISYPLQSCCPCRKDCVLKSIPSILFQRTN